MTAESDANSDPNTIAGLEQLRYRAYLQNADGTVEDVPADQLVGIDQFLDSWQRSTDTPQELVGSMWQGPDDGHRLGAGQTAYRVVYKALKIVAYPAAELTWPNLRVVIRNGDVHRGRATVPRTVPGRSPRHVVLPEYGRLVEHPGGAGYLGCPDMNVEICGEEDTVQALSYVEIIVHLDDIDPDSTYEALLVRERQAIGPLKTMLDLKFGPRLLAMPITEEVGETFDDWHWNRYDHTALLTVESQAALMRLEPTTVVEEVWPLIERQQDLPEEQRRRLSLACQWYWRADAEPSDVLHRLVGRRRVPRDAGDNQPQASSATAGSSLRHRRGALGRRWSALPASQRPGTRQRLGGARPAASAS